MEEREIRIEYVDFEEVEKWPRNPKDHDLHELKKSFDRWGFIKPVLVDEGSQRLVAGHGRVDTLKFLKREGKEAPRGVFVENGKWKIPVLRGVTFENEAEAEAFLLADNRLAEIGGWKKDLLAEMLSEIMDVEGALEGIGFDIAEIMDITGESKHMTDDEIDKMKDDFRHGVLIAIGFFNFLVTNDMLYFDKLKQFTEPLRLTEEETLQIVEKVANALGDSHGEASN